MSAEQNEAAGRGLGAFYIKAPNVESCRPDAVRVVNP
jgi:hypothetical protein